MTQEGTAVFCPHCEKYLTDHPSGFLGAHGEQGRMRCEGCHKPFQWEAKVSIIFVTTTLGPPAPAAAALRAAS